MSTPAGLIGMSIATRANSRTTTAADRNWHEGLVVAYLAVFQEFLSSATRATSAACATSVTRATSATRTGNATSGAARCVARTLQSRDCSNRFKT
jgi:hypothetical protein